MKCRSVVGIWPETPPSHHVTAVAVIHHPPSLFTGAADGSIASWHFSDDPPSSAKIRPVAILCGHAAPIADLCICYPLLPSPDKKVDHDRDVGVSSSPSDQAALLSACSDGVLCVWSRGSGHCRRRRKLPPWVGSPSMVRMVPANRRYVCVASCFTDTVHSSDHEYTDSAEGSEVTGDQESRKATKCTVVIVDSYTLTIVQTVFHGYLSIGPLMFMTLVESPGDHNDSAIMFDSYGKAHFIPLVSDANLDMDSTSKLHDNSALVNTTNLINGSCEGELLVSVATCGQMLGLVYKSQCVFLLVSGATVIGVLSFESNAYHSKADCTLSCVAGGMFIPCDNSCTSESGKTQNILDVPFVVWDDRGYSIIYKISFMDDTFKSDVFCEIPAISVPPDENLSAKFVQFSHYFLRVESICFRDEEPFLWRPRVTIWSLHQQFNDNENCGKGCRLLGKGDFLVDWINGPSDASKSEPPKHALNKNYTTRKAALTSIDSVPGLEDDITLSKDDLKYTLVHKERIVSSTMVISENGHIPYAVVYGYHSGEIELVQLKILTHEVSADGVSVGPAMVSEGPKQRFLGHTGPVLCLATHQMVNTANKRAYENVLVSGSMDCTLRIWDLESCNPIMVMHHHVAPIRQIVLPPLQSDHPWNDCFLSVGEDSCIALVSLETLRVERIFPGHPSYPVQVVWDGVRSYLACLSQNHSVTSSVKDALYIWDIKAGSRERVLRGTAALSMFNNFCKGVDTYSILGCASIYNASTSSLALSLTEDGGSLSSKLENSHSFLSSEANSSERDIKLVDSSKGQCVDLGRGKHDKVPIRCFCPISGIAMLCFDLPSLLSLDVHEDGGKQWKGLANDLQGRDLQETIEGHQCLDSYKLCFLRFCLSFLHLWGVDFELDNLLMLEMNVKRYEKLMLAPGLEGDRGSFTLAFPAFSSTLQLWKSSPEFCALRSLTMVSLAQSMVSLSHSFSGASSALAAFYTRNFAEKVSDVRPPSLQLLVSVWQDEDEHVRMAARSLFHCAASRAIPPPLNRMRTTDQTETFHSVDHWRGSNLECATKKETRVNSVLAETPLDMHQAAHNGEAEIVKWLDSYELQDWISCVGGTSQDAMASHIIVAAALAIWYPSLVKSTLAMLVVHPLIKLVMAMNEKYSSTAAELLAEGMDSTWKACLGAEIHHLIGDIFFQIECVSGVSVNNSSVAAAVPPKLRETLVSVLLPSLALADIPGFLSVIEGLIWSTASDSPVHLVSLKTLIRLIRGSAKNVAQYLNKVVNFILQTIDPANSVMRKTCLQSSMATLREVVRIYPMVALNETSTRLAVGDAIAEVNNASILVYDMQSVTKIKVLDASGPSGLPTSLFGALETVTAAISALSFSPDGEGLVAFSERGLIIRWWSVGTAWWEKLSRNFIPVQCTKLIFVPPWEGFSPNSSRASIMANIAENGRQAHSQENMQSSGVDSLNLLLYNLDLYYRLEWVGNRKVRLMRHGHELEMILL